MKESLELQAGRIQRAIEASGYHVFPEDGVFQEPFTGTTDERPAYRRAIALIKSNPRKIRYFFISTLDRFSREGAYRYKQTKMELASLGVQLRDIGGVVQPPANSLEHLGFTYSWSVWSPSDVGEMAIAESNNQERSRILTRLMEAEIKLTQDGDHLGLANDGYVSRRVFINLKKKGGIIPRPRARTLFSHDVCHAQGGQPL